MVFTSEIRHNPTTGKDEHYHSLRESFRDLTGTVRQKVLMNIGFEPEMTRGQMSEAAIPLSCKVQQSRKYQMPALFEAEPGQHYSEQAHTYADRIWNKLIDEKLPEMPRQIIKDSRRKVRKIMDVNIVKHNDAREVGAENVCLQAVRALRLEEFLHAQKWDRRKIETTMASLIARTVYYSSEWKTLRLLKENPAAMELITGKFGDTPTQREVYGAPLALYELKDKLERHLLLLDRLAVQPYQQHYPLRPYQFLLRRQQTELEGSEVRISREKRSDCWCLPWP